MTMWSDWGAASWTEDPEDAAIQAADWVSTTATARDWPMEWVDVADSIIVTASAADTAESFWRSVLSLWESYDGAAAAAGIEGWAELGDAFASAAGASYTISEARESGSFLGVVSGAAQATAADVQATVDPRKSIWPWLAGAAILGFVWFKVR